MDQKSAYHPHLGHTGHTEYTFWESVGGATRRCQERKLAIELLMIQTGTLLESSNENQPLEEGDEFRANEELVCAVDFLLEPYWSAC